MKSAVRVRFEAGARVLQFTRTHPSTEPGYATILGTLEGLMTRAGEIATRQHDGLAIARGAKTRRMERRRELHTQVLPHLIRVGEAAARIQPELAGRFVLPSNSATYKTYLTAATAMLHLAETNRDLLVSKGLTGSALEDLGRLVQEFETATDDARSGRITHIGARADLDVVTGEIMEIIRILDGINRYRFGKDPEGLAEWNAAKQIPAVPVRVPSLRLEAPKPTPGNVAPAA